VDLRGATTLAAMARWQLSASAVTMAALATGAYNPLIGLRLPLDQIAEAQDSGAVIGKIVLDVP